MSNVHLPPPAAGNEALTQYRLGMIEETLKAISDSLGQLAALEQKHIETREALGRAFKQLTDQDQRLRLVETELPTLKLVRGWVISGVIGVLGMLGIALFKVFSPGL